MIKQINNKIKQNSFLKAPGGVSVSGDSLDQTWMRLDVMRVCWLLLCLIFLLSIGFSSSVRAQQADDFLKKELKDQADEVKRLEKEINQVRPAEPDKPQLAPVSEYQEETPCFEITKVELEGRAVDKQFFKFALDELIASVEYSPVGRCIGSKGIGVVIKTLQNSVIKAGYTTTRFSVGEQDLKTGILKVNVVGGVVGEILLESNTAAAISEMGLRNAVVLKTGDYVNARAIEQSVENLKRANSIEANIEIVPTSQVGESNLVVIHRQSRPVRFTATLDNTGSELTGKYQGGLTIAYDNLWMLNDQLSVTAKRNVFGKTTPQLGDRGNRNLSLSYSIPIGYWSFSAVSTLNETHQQMNPVNQNPFESSSKSGTLDLRATRLWYRTANLRLLNYFKIWKSDSDSFVNKTKIDVQTKKRSGWEVGITYKDLFLKDLSWDSTLSLKKGANIFGQQIDLSADEIDSTKYFKLLSLDINASKPFKLGELPIDWSGDFHYQRFLGLPLSAEEASIGGRGSVRGFNAGISAERGWNIKNDFSTPLLQTGYNLYLGWDYGRVSGPSADSFVYKALAGTTLGIKGALFKVINVDASFSKATLRPYTIEDPGYIFTFTMSSSF